MTDIEDKNRDDEAMRKEEGLKRKEEEAERKAEELKRKEEEAKRKEDELKRKEDDSKRKEDELRRKEDESKSKEEELKRKEEEIKRASNARLKQAEPNQIIRDCLFYSFDNYEDIYYNFYTLYFEDFAKELNILVGYGSSIWKLINHCNQHGRVEDLWVYIKNIRDKQYDKYYPKWEQAINENQENYNNKNSVYLKLGSVIREKPMDADGQAHPLSGNDRLAINDWFFNKLDAHEQSQVMTVALFEGINRKLMEPIYQEIERIFFEKNKSI